MKMKENEKEFKSKNKNLQSIRYLRRDKLVEKWVNKDGLYNRDSGPACIEYDIDGSIEYEYYYIKGNFYDKEDFESMKK